MEKRQVIIIGAGLAGLTLAYRLKQQGIEALILEGRDRLGGRIHTLNRNGVTLELGATWFADKHRNLNALIEELGLDKIPQEYGKYAIYEMADQPPVLYPLPEQPEITYRLKEGSMALINALAAQLNEGQIQLEEKVHALDFSGEKVSITCEEKAYEAAVVVNTLPPNLLASTVHFNPTLPQDLKSLSEETHTWMGESIKAGFFAKQAFWLEKEIGTLYSQKGPFTEMYDHSNSHGHAMKGFLNDRLSLLSKDGRREAVLAQLSPLFGGKQMSETELVEKVWSEDELTYSPYNTDVFPHQNNGAMLFRQPFFDNRFYMAGSETALSFPGYMDGAVEAANRVARQLSQVLEQGISAGQ